MLVGTLTAYLLKVWVPASLRARELEPVVLLREHLGELEGHVANIPTAMVPVLSRRLKELTAALNDKELDAAHLLHRVPPLPFNDGVDTAKLAALLQRHQRNHMAGVVLVDGLLKAKELGSMAPAQHHLIFNAYKTIDGRLDQSPSAYYQERWGGSSKAMWPASGARFSRPSWAPPPRRHSQAPLEARSSRGSVCNCRAEFFPPRCGSWGHPYGGDRDHAAGIREPVLRPA